MAVVYVLAAIAIILAATVLLGWQFIVIFILLPIGILSVKSFLK